MAQSSQTFTRKKALRLIVAAAVILLLLILLRAFLGGPNLSTREGRVEFLSSLGWEADVESEEYKRVRIPSQLEGALAEYNQMQLEQNCDLTKHLGEACDQYCYRITNYPDSEQTVLAVLYVQGRRLIAGDIHSTALNGFMHGLQVK